MKNLKIIMIAIITVVLIGLGLFFAIKYDRGIPLTAAKAAHMAKLDGTLVAQLPSGFVHYDLRGPAAGECVVLLPGAVVPMEIWKDTRESLASAGYQVLSYDFYGRGLSERLDTEYNLDLFLNELTELLAFLKIDKPVHLIGSSMGAVVAVEFALRHPERTRKLILIDPAGSEDEEQKTFESYLIRWPIIGDLIMAVYGDKIILNRAL